MRSVAFSLDDRAVALARDGRVLCCAPSVVFDGTDGEAAGSNAWHALRLKPTAISTRHLGTLLRGEVTERALGLFAAELQNILAARPVAPGERVWIAAPANAGTLGLGATVALCRGLKIPLEGFVDAATAAVAALATEGSSIVLELGLHHAAATLIEHEAGQIRRRRAVSSERGGLLDLYEAWLTLVATSMVKRTRFDPLHEAAGEQQLFDQLDAFTREALVKGATRAVLTRGSESFEVELTRDQFEEAGQETLRELARLLHGLRPAGTPVALVVPEPVAALPGVRGELEEFAGCELVSIPDGFAAAALSLLELPLRSESDAPRLMRRLPAQPQPTLTGALTRVALGVQPGGVHNPSHVLFNGHAYALTTGALLIGRTPQSSPSITLPEGLAGVSRRHCTLLREGDELLLLDHSRYGTFLNGERVSERVRVHAGDRIRVGEPGIELALIEVAAS